MKITKQWRNDLLPYIGKTGIYALMCYDDCLYVGQATCLSRRVLQHLRKYPEITNVQIYDYSTMFESRTYSEHKILLNDLEISYIHKLNPTYNKQVGKMRDLRWYLENYPKNLLEEFIFPAMGNFPRLTP